MLIGAMPLIAVAQVDDLYFIPKKKVVEKVTDDYGVPKDTYYSGSDRSVDDYNRRESSYEVIGDSLRSDVIDLTTEQGVYPDSLEDYQLTKKMTRFDDYELSANASFWAGYAAGRHDWGWHSPWYYSRFGWYGGWYDPWYSPWYYSSWYGGWYDPWYYNWYSGWYGWYGGWYNPWYYGYYGWGYPYYWGGYPLIGHVGPSYTSTHIGTGTIRNNGSTHTAYSAPGRWSVAGNSSRMNSINKRAERMGGSRNNSGNNTRSRSGNFSGYRGSNNSNNSNSSSSSRNSSFSSTRSSSSGGSYSGGGNSGSGRSSGGGGGRSGGRR